jgi:hypothetical protein
LTLSLFEHSSGRERLPSGWVAPMHVLAHHQHGSLRRQTFDLRQLRVKHFLLPFLVVRLSGG